MKTKRFFAILIAMLILTATFITTVSAEETTSIYNLVMTGKAGYTFTVYRLANFDPTTGEYDYMIDDANLKSAIEAPDETTNIINNRKALEAANNIPNASLADLVESVLTYTNDNSLTFSTNTAGVFFIKATAGPDGYTEVNNSILQLPYYVNNTRYDSYSFNLGTKVTSCGTGENSDLNKKITNSDIMIDSNVAATDKSTADIGEVVNFTISGPVLGSKDQNLQYFALADTLSSGFDLISTESDISVKLINDIDNSSVTLTEGTDYDFVTNYDFDTDGKANATFAIVLKEAVLDKTTKFDTTKVFYDYTDISVDYSAKLNANAVMGKDGNTNTVTVDYTNDPSANASDTDGTNIEVDGPTVTVYTYQVKVTKVDAVDSNTVLKGAEFTLYTDEDCTAVAKVNEADLVVTTDDDGIANFVGLGSGTYYLKETKAPQGYNIDHNVYPLVIEAATPENQVDDNSFTYTADNGLYATTIKDVHLFMPITGGQGAFLLTVCGASLTVIGGILLFFILRKKKNS